MEKINFLYKPISETDYLTDNQLDAIEAGSCDSGCKKACLPGNQNAGNGNSTQKQAEADSTPTQSV